MIPTMQNCSHSGDGWCLQCVKALETQLAEFNRTEPLKRGELRTLREENDTLRARLAELEKIAEALAIRLRGRMLVAGVRGPSWDNDSAAIQSLSDWREKGTK